MGHRLAVLLAPTLLFAVACSSSATSGRFDDTDGQETGVSDVAPGDAGDADGERADTNRDDSDTGGLADVDADDADGADAGNSGAGDGSLGDADSDGSGADAGPEPISLAISPLEVDLAITAGGPAAEAHFVATATLDGGGESDVTDAAGWTVDNLAIGDAVAGVFTTSGVAGGTALVTARLGDLEATARVNVHISAAVVPPDEGGSTLPDDFPDDVAREPAGGALAILYPNHETMFPQNIHRVRFEWTVERAYESFRLRFTGDFVDLSAFTTDTNWTPDAEQWRWMARSAAGSSLTWVVEGAAGDGTIHVSEPITLYFSESDVPGAIYYWSTTTQAVMRGAPASDAPELFYPQDGRTCVACHTVSRDGRRLAVGYDGEDLQVASVPERETLVPAGTWDMGWATFSPDGERLLIARRGQLRLVETDTGNPIGPSDGVLDFEMLLTHPDWAPSGNFVVAVTGTRVGDKAVEGGSIVRIPIVDGVFGDPVVIVPSAGDRENNFFPMVSPDSSLVAFVNSDGRSKDQVTAELRLVRLAEPDRVIPVDRLNHRANNAWVDGVGTSMPTWAPSTSAGTQWLAFASLRDYATVVTGGGDDQLWIAAIDPELVPIEATDPSYAAFWIPFQDPDASNHRAFWAFDPDVECAADGEVCDGFDNDCDGEVDEDCVACGDTETCDDRIDNDCDGAVDEGCAEPECVEEICRDLVDNDCDDLVDEGCPECVDEVCDDDIDNDCDGEIDEGCECIGREICYDGIDNDCDGSLDPPPPDCDPI